jgi:HD-GYP domain-containing protein (c-di-GMP phosphodiesterase class II)
VVHRDILFRLIKLVEAKDNVTAAHTWRVSLYTQAIAERMDFDRPTVQSMMRGAALHDVGKIDIPTDILNKPTRLNDEEIAVIRAHPMLGYRRLIALGETDQIVLDIVRSHHERLDGSGYPDGLEGDAIPLAARLFAVIDTFDAMTSVRSYRPTFRDDVVDRAFDDLNRYAGIWYCPATVKVFQRLFESGQLQWIHEHFNDAQSLRVLDSPVTVDEIEAVSQRAGRNVDSRRSSA